MMTRSAFITFCVRVARAVALERDLGAEGEQLLGQAGALVAVGLADLGDPEAVRRLDVELAVRVAEPDAADDARRG